MYSVFDSLIYLLVNEFMIIYWCLSRQTLTSAILPPECVLRKCWFCVCSFTITNILWDAVDVDGGVWRRQPWGFLYLSHECINNLIVYRQHKNQKVTIISHNIQFQLDCATNYMECVVDLCFRKFDGSLNVFSQTSHLYGL